MRHFLIVFLKEYMTNLRSKAFLFFTFGLPIFMMVIPSMVFMAGIFFQAAITQDIDKRPIAMIDQAHLLNQINELPAFNAPLTFIATPEEGQIALENGVIQAYYVIPPDYWETGNIYAHYNEPISSIDDLTLNLWFENRVRQRIPSDIRPRLNPLGTTIVRQDKETATQVSLEETNLEWMFVYMIVYFIRNANLFVATRTFDSIVNESENRTLEILITSLSPTTFVAAKISGLMAVGVTQLFMWGLPLLFGLSIYEMNSGGQIFRMILAWEHLPLVLSLIIASAILDHILAAGVGMLQVGGGLGSLLLNLQSLVMLFVFPYSFLFVPRSPDTWLAFAAGAFPLSAPFVVPIRVIVSEVPFWEIAVTQILLWGTNFLAILWVKWLIQRKLVERTPTFSLQDWAQDKGITPRQILGKIFPRFASNTEGGK